MKRALILFLLLFCAGCVSTYMVLPDGAVYSENYIIKEETTIVNGKPIVTKRTVIPAKFFLEGSLDKILKGLKLVYE